MENSMDLLSLISGLGNDPSAMSAVTELLKNLGNTQPRQPAVNADTVSAANFSRSSQPTQQLPTSSGGDGGASGFSPELLGSLLSALGGTHQREPRTENCPSESKEHGGHSSVEKLLGGKAESENRIRLLNALRPYLSEERRCKLDLILKLLRIAELGKLSGILNSV